MLLWDRQGNCELALILSYLDVADDAIENVIAQAIEFLSACYLLLVVWHAPLGARSAKRRHQSPEWTILSQINASSRERLLDFRSCWIVFIHVHCVQKKTPTHIFSYLHELFVDLNKNCSEYTQGLIDSENVKIRYSLRSMT